MRTKKEPSNRIIRIFEVCKPALHPSQYYGADYLLSGDRYWSHEFWETYGVSSLIPELTVTAPTPEIGISAKFPSEDQPCELLCDSGLDYQRPEANYEPETANACRTNQLRYSTALASISKALGTGADMLLGVGNGVFDDIFDVGIVSSGASQPRAPAVAIAHAEGHFDNDWLGPTAAQSLGKKQTETGLLGQLLRRRGTRKSQMPDRRNHVWQRVSRILRSGRTSSISAQDQEKSVTSSAGSLYGSHAASRRLNASRSWKRFSDILANATVSSRRRSAGDQVQFSESANLLDNHSRVLDSGSTRRRGLDILSDSAGYVDEH